VLCTLSSAQPVIFLFFPQSLPFICSFYSSLLLAMNVTRNKWNVSEIVVFSSM